MKRTGRLFEAILAYDNLGAAVHRALKGKRNRPEAREWMSNLDVQPRSASPINLCRHLSLRPFSSVRDLRSEGTLDYRTVL